MATVWMETVDGSVFSTESPHYHEGCKRITAKEGKAKDKAEAREQLRGLFPPGSTVPTVLRHVSASGMSRRIGVLHVEGGRVRDVSYLVARALEMKIHDSGGLIVGGCGMDMGFSVVYNLSHALHGDGYPCQGKDAEGRRACPSNYHTNHRDSIRCEGLMVATPDGDERRHCYKPSAFGRWPVPDGWPVVVLFEGTELEQTHLAACLTNDGGDAVEVCPTCKGRGELPNPEGPERFDLVHVDGYALRHEWI